MAWESCFGKTGPMTQMPTSASQCLWHFQFSILVSQVDDEGVHLRSFKLLPGKDTLILFFRTA